MLNFKFVLNVTWICNHDMRRVLSLSVKQIIVRQKTIWTRQSWPTDQQNYIENKPNLGVADIEVVTIKGNIVLLYLALTYFFVQKVLS